MNGLCNVFVVCRVAMVLCVGMLARVNCPLCWELMNGLCNVFVVCRVAMVLCVGMLARVNIPLCWDMGYVTCRNDSLCEDVRAMLCEGSLCINYFGL